MATGADVHRSAKRVSLGALLLTCGLFVVAAAVLFAELRPHSVWAPLDDYPVQQVLSRVEGVDGPAVRIGELVTVDAVKCNATDEDVEVVGTVSWQAMDPPGAVITTGSGTGTRPPGCHEQSFANPIPAGVESVISAQHAAGINAPEWRIQGDETPVRDGGADGQPARWVTESFAVVP